MCVLEFLISRMGDAAHVSRVLSQVFKSLLNVINVNMDNFEKLIFQFDWKIFLVLGNEQMVNADRILD